MKSATLDVRYSAHSGSGLVDWAKKVSHSIRTWNSRRVAIAELRRLSDDQLDDIGVVRANIPEVVDGLLRK